MPEASPRCSATERPRFVVLAARGTSDHAALYAKYLLEVRLGLPCGLASPSTMTGYGARPQLTDCLVVAVSQSGGSPDLVETMHRRARVRGDHARRDQLAGVSHLAAAAELHLDVRAGAERAIAATKTYGADSSRSTCSSTRGRAAPAPAAAKLPAAASRLVARRPEVADLAQLYRFASPAGDDRSRLRLPDRARGRHQADGDELTWPRTRSPGPTCCTGRWR